MGFVWLGIVLLVLGVVLAFVGLGSIGGVLANVSWVLIIAGILLALVSLLTGGRAGTV